MDKDSKSPLTITQEEYKGLISKFSVFPSSYTKPIRIYMDVDGVIKPSVKSEEELNERFPNAVEIDVVPHYSWDDPMNLLRGKFWWNEDVVARLAKLSRHPHIDFVWLTDWRVSAPTALDELLGIHSLGYLDWQKKFTDYNQFFKRVAILDEQKEAPSKFIWVDDRANIPDSGAPHVFSEEKDDYEWEFNDEGEPTGGTSEAYTDVIPPSQYLNVITDKYEGLTLANLEKIEEWVAKNIS